MHIIYTLISICPLSAACDLAIWAIRRLSYRISPWRYCRDTAQGWPQRCPCHCLNSLWNLSGGNFVGNPTFIDHCHLKYLPTLGGPQTPAPEMDPPLLSPLSHTDSLQLFPNPPQDFDPLGVSPLYEYDSLSGSMGSL